MPLSLDKEITFLRSIPGFGQYLSEGLRKIQEGVNGLGQNIATDPTNTVPPPPAIQQLMVKTNGTGLVHATISDNNAIQKHLNYFIEYSNEPAFLQPHVVHLGASRTMSPMTLPGMDDNGKPQSFYFRAYSSYLGGNAGPKVSSSTAVNPGGSQMLTLLPSTGSGTASGNGQQGGTGFGPVLFRPSPGPKRKAK